MEVPLTSNDRNYGRRSPTTDLLALPLQAAANGELERVLGDIQKNEEARADLTSR